MESPQQPPARPLDVDTGYGLWLAALPLLVIRQGYRWARTVLTGGGIATIVYVTTSLFTVQRGTAAAVVYAITAIVASVLIAGGVFLLHRKDAHAFFTR